MLNKILKTILLSLSIFQFSLSMEDPNKGSGANLNSNIDQEQHQNKPISEIKSFWAIDKGLLTTLIQSTKTSFIDWADKISNQNVFCTDPTQIDINNQIIDFIKNENNLHLIENTWIYPVPLMPIFVSNLLINAHKENELGKFESAKTYLETAKLLMQTVDTPQQRILMGAQDRVKEIAIHPIKTTIGFINCQIEIAGFVISLARDTCFNNLLFTIKDRLCSNYPTDNLLKTYEDIIQGKNPEYQDPEVIKVVKKEYESAKATKERVDKLWQNCWTKPYFDSVQEAIQHISDLPNEKKLEVFGMLAADAFITHKAGSTLNTVKNKASTLMKSSGAFNNMQKGVDFILKATGLNIVSDRIVNELENLCKKFPNKKTNVIRELATENGRTTLGTLGEARTMLILEEKSLVKNIARPISPSQAKVIAMEYLSENGALEDIVREAKNLIEKQSKSIPETRAFIKSQLKNYAKEMADSDVKHNGIIIKGLAEQPIEAAISELSKQVKRELKIGVNKESNIYKVAEDFKIDISQIAKEGIKESKSGLGVLGKAGDARIDFICKNKNGTLLNVDIKEFNPKFDSPKSFIEKMKKGLNTGEVLAINLELADAKSCSELLKDLLEHCPEAKDKIFIVINEASQEALSKSAWFKKYENNLAVSKIPPMNTTKLLENKFLQKTNFFHDIDICDIAFGQGQGQLDNLLDVLNITDTSHKLKIKSLNHSAQYLKNFFNEDEFNQNKNNNTTKYSQDNNISKDKGKEKVKEEESNSNKSTTRGIDYVNTKTDFQVIIKPNDKQFTSTEAVGLETVAIPVKINQIIDIKGENLNPEQAAKVVLFFSKNPGITAISGLNETNFLEFTKALSKHYCPREKIAFVIDKANEQHIARNSKLKSTYQFVKEGPEINTTCTTGPTSYSLTQIHDNVDFGLISRPVMDLKTRKTSTNTEMIFKFYPKAPELHDQGSETTTRDNSVYSKIFENNGNIYKANESNIPGYFDYPQNIPPYSKFSVMPGNDLNIQIEQNKTTQDKIKKEEPLLDYVLNKSKFGLSKDKKFIPPCIIPKETPYQTAKRYHEEKLSNMQKTYDFSITSDPSLEQKLINRYKASQAWWSMILNYEYNKEFRKGVNEQLKSISHLVILATKQQSLQGILSRINLPKIQVPLLFMSNLLAYIQDVNPYYYNTYGKVNYKIENHEKVIGFTAELLRSILLKDKDYNKAINFAKENKAHELADAMQKIADQRTCDYSTHRNVLLQIKDSFCDVAAFFSGDYICLGYGDMLHRIKNNNFNKTVLDLVDKCQNNKFEEASSIIKKASKSDKILLEDIYNQLHKKTYNSIGLFKFFKNDPLYKKISTDEKMADDIKNSKTSQDYFNRQLTARHEIRQIILSNYQISPEELNKNKVLNDFIYKLIDVQISGNNKDLLYNVNIDNEKLKSLIPFFFKDNGMMKNMDDADITKLFGQFEWPKNIHSKKNIYARKLLNVLTGLNKRINDKKALIKAFKHLTLSSKTSGPESYNHFKIANGVLTLTLSGRNKILLKNIKETDFIPEAQTKDQKEVNNKLLFLTNEILATANCTDNLSEKEILLTEHTLITLSEKINYFSKLNQTGDNGNTLNQAISEILININVPREILAAGANWKNTNWIKEFISNKTEEELINLLTKMRKTRID